jgi:myo-inositol-1(or 4)-monophosphatase
MLSSSQNLQVESLVNQVGAYIRNERMNFQSNRVEYKDVHDLVSYVDKTSEKKLIEGLEKIIPGSAFRGEESGTHLTNSPYTWIIDPLDGTTNFIHNIPHYCISIGLQYQGSMLAGWVYEICSEEMYQAIKGQGAYCNQVKIAVSQTTNLPQSLIGTGFPVRSYDQLGGYLNLLQWVIENTRGLRRLGTAAYDLCMVASGRFEAFYEPRLNAWDVAAGSIIVQEAGGTVTDFKNGTGFIDGGEILATNGRVHEVLLTAIQQNLK